MKKLLSILVSASILLSLTGCIGGPRDEKQDFIDATIEATCEIFQAEDIYDPALEEKAKEIYENYGFDADDDEGMRAIADKYSEDEGVQTAIIAGIEKCSEGIPGLEGLLEAAEEAEAALEEEGAEGEEEEPPAEEEPEEEPAEEEEPPPAEEEPTEDTGEEGGEEEPVE